MHHTSIKGEENTKMDIIKGRLIMEQIRAFIAIELPEKLRKQLSHLQNVLKKDTGISAKWVDPYSIHLTLKFLGNVPSSQIEDIKKSMEQATLGIAPFHLEMKNLGVFPGLTRVQVIWVGLSGDTDKLSQLQKRVEENMSHLGFAPEGRAFTAHLTLARVRERISAEEQQKLGQLIASGVLEESHRFEVTSINLMRSQLTPQGAIYSKLHSAGLG